MILVQYSVALSAADTGPALGFTIGSVLGMIINVSTANRNRNIDIEFKGYEKQLDIRTLCYSDI